MSYESTCYGVLVDVSGSMESALSQDFKWDDDDNRTRAHAVFRTIFQTVRDVGTNDVKTGNDTFFALAFGLKDAGHQHCDLFGLFEHLLQVRDLETRTDWLRILPQNYGINNARQYIRTERKYNLQRNIILGYQPLVEMAKRNGAPYAEHYIKKHCTEEQAGQIFMHFHRRQELMRLTVCELPAACKEEAAFNRVRLANDGGIGAAGVALGAVAIVLTGGWAGVIAAGVLNVAGHEAQTRAKKSEDDTAKKALEKSEDRIFAPVYDIVKTARPRREAIQIVDDLSKTYKFESAYANGKIDVDALLRDIKRKIYGGTPMRRSLRYSQQIFNLSAPNTKQKRLLIISDGGATDGDPIPIANELRDSSGVVVACCFITDQDIPNPTQLYDTMDANWSKGAKTMFKMASSVSNSDSSLSLLLKGGWDLAPSGQSKLFIQANHPDVITQFCAVINDIAHYNDCMMEMVGHYDFDKYINSKISGAEAPEQDGGTCYANATAMGLHLAMARIKGRDGGYPEFEQLRQAMIEKYKKEGKCGANTETVLKEFCELHRLQYQERKTDQEIKKTIMRRRPLVARFRLSYAGWDNFSAFYAQQPKGILSATDITKATCYSYFRFPKDNVSVYADAKCTKKAEQSFKAKEVLKGDYIASAAVVKLPTQHGNSQTVYCKASDIAEIDGHTYDGGGHAVLLIRCQPGCLVFMNSWGTDWGDNGFFRVAKKDVLAFKNNKMQCFDVYWTLNDLSQNEKKAYGDYCKQKMQQVMDGVLPRGVYELEYRCPCCSKMSKIKDYSGDFMQAICPQCKGTFKPNGIGLARSLYDRQLSSE